MPLPRAILFVDGENLTMRYQAMVAAGAVPRPDVIHRQDVYVWHPRILRTLDHELQKIVRVCYYTSVVGSDNQLVEIKQSLSRIEYSSRGDDGAISGQLVPVVFKKPARSQKTRNVDIQVVIDIMRFAFTDEIERVYLVSGDGDYLPLIEEVMRRGKQVEILALSSGLNGILRYSVDRFYELDSAIFDGGNEG